MEAVRLDRYWAALSQLSTVSKRVKLFALASVLGISVFGLLAKYLRRRRTGKKFNTRNGFMKKIQGGTTSTSNQNGDIRRCTSPSTVRYINKQGSVSLSSDRNSATSTRSSSTIANMTPQQLGLMGMEALETAINYWEDALHASIPVKGKQLSISDPEKSSFIHLLEKIVERSYNLQHTCEKLFLHQNSILFRDDASISSITDRFIDERRTVVSMSSVDSFVSAQAEVADLREFDEFWDVNIDATQLEFYTTSLKQLEENGIPCRSLRTETVGCQTDVEYLAKLNCIRLAFQLLFKDESVKKYFVNSGKELLSGILLRANKDPKELLASYDKIISFVDEEKNWIKIEEELNGRGVKCMTFYDIVLDFIILDAFEDLESPPSSVTSVVQNRWLSNGFKEIALGTAVWSVLKAKRQLLKFSDGFIAHFYAISEDLSPVLAWGFLGPESDLKDICQYFKEQVIGFLHDVYNYHKVRYTTVEDLAQDVLSLAKVRYEITSAKISL